MAGLDYRELVVGHPEDGGAAAGADRAEMYATLCHDTAEELRDALDEQDRRWRRFTTPRRSTMAGRCPLRSVLAALLFIPLLLAASSGGCDCDPKLPETNAVGCGNTGSSDEEPNSRDLTTSTKGSRTGTAT